MSPFCLRTVLSGIAVCVMTLAAEAQSDACNPAGSNVAVSATLNADDAKLLCDLERAAVIRQRASRLYATGKDSVLEIIDTAAPSGAAYIYDVMADGATLKLDARSVPDGRGPRCRLETVLPEDASRSVTQLMTEAAGANVPDYGSREEVTLNPDGSRRVRLVIDSHDIITRAVTPGGERNFSRHAGSDDPVSRLNNLVIGIANVSPGWVCNAAS